MGKKNNKKSVKKRIPLPLKPPKAEPPPNAYRRRPKHQKDLTKEIEQHDAAAGTGD